MSTRIAVKDYYKRTDITRFAGRDGRTHQLTQKIDKEPFYMYVQLTEEDILDLARVIETERARTEDVEEEL